MLKKCTVLLSLVFFNYCSTISFAMESKNSLGITNEFQRNHKKNIVLYSLTNDKLKELDELLNKFLKSEEYRHEHDLYIDSYISIFKQIHNDKETVIENIRTYRNTTREDAEKILHDIANGKVLFFRKTYENLFAFFSNFFKKKRDFFGKSMEFFNNIEEFPIALTVDYNLDKNIKSIKEPSIGKKILIIGRGNKQGAYVKSGTLANTFLKKKDGVEKFVYNDIDGKSLNPDGSPYIFADFSYNSEAVKDLVDKLKGEFDGVIIDASTTKFIFNPIGDIKDLSSKGNILMKNLGKLVKSGGFFLIPLECNSRFYYEKKTIEDINIEGFDNTSKLNLLSCTEDKIGFGDYFCCNGIPNEDILKQLLNNAGVKYSESVKSNAETWILDGNDIGTYTEGRSKDDIVHYVIFQKE